MFNPITPGLFWRLNPWGGRGEHKVSPSITQEQNMET